MKNFDITVPPGAAARKPGYVLVTPVKDEESLIAETIASVVSQSCQPLQWVIVDDGSTDRTTSIVSFAAARHPWIRLVCLPRRTQRSFAAVVHATEAGVKALSVDDYQYIGLLDADLRFAPDYFEQVIARFEASPCLGLGGGHVVDLGLPKNRLPRNRQDVPGAAQFFRRRCFEKLGGLLAIPEGGWDALTCLRARMIGYETRLFTDLVVDHLKPRNIAEGGWLRRMCQMGVRDYALGYHPVFEIFKCIDRLTEPPVGFGAATWLYSYCIAWFIRRDRFIPAELLKFAHAEQWKRLKQTLDYYYRLP